MSEPVLEKVEKCRLCGSTFDFFIEYPNIPWYDEHLALLKCPLCGLICTDTRPHRVDYIRSNQDSYVSKHLYELKPKRFNPHDMVRNIFSTAWIHDVHPTKIIWNTECVSNNLMKWIRMSHRHAIGNTVNRYNHNILVSEGFESYNCTTSGMVNEIKDESVDIVLMVNSLGKSYNIINDILVAYRKLREGGLLYIRGQDIYQRIDEPLDADINFLSIELFKYIMPFVEFDKFNYHMDKHNKVVEVEAVK